MDAQTCFGLQVLGDACVYRLQHSGSTPASPKTKKSIPPAGSSNLEWHYYWHNDCPPKDIRDDGPERQLKSEGMYRWTNMNPLDFSSGS